MEVQGHTEQPRVLLVSVPYALKALDAETIGGKPASAFMMALASNSKSQSPILPPGTITGSGTADFVPVFAGAKRDWKPRIAELSGRWELEDYTSRCTRCEGHRKRPQRSHSVPQIHS